MSAHCVGCGKELTEPAVYGRCTPCFKFWDQSGRNERRVITTTMANGIRIGHTVFGTRFARYCRLCGRIIPDRRALYALRRGHECQTCGSCS